MLHRHTYALLAVVGLMAAACNQEKSEKTSDQSGAADAGVTSTSATVGQPSNTNPNEPASANAADAGATSGGDPIANAENASKVKQYPDQTKMAPTRAELLTTHTTVRSTAQGGESITVVQKGQPVTEVAKAHDYYLVMFPDPKDSAKQLAGWVYKDSLEPIAEAGAKTAGTEKGTAATTEAAGKNAKTGEKTAKTGATTEKAPACKPGEVHVQTSNEFCATACKDDADCKKVGGVCDGEGKILKGATPTTGRYCVGMSASSESTTGAHTAHP